MSTEPNTGLTYQEAGSLQTDALQNELVNYLGVWLNCVVQSVGDTAPPGSPVNGHRYIVGASATGAWSTHDDALAIWRDGWQFYAPPAAGVPIVKNRGDGADWECSDAGVWSAKTASGGAADIGYDNTASGLTASNTQDAIDELAALATSSFSIGLTFQADTLSTTDADPGAGNLRWNNATQASATVLFLDDVTYGGGVTLTGIWAALIAGGFAYLQHPDDANIWSINLVTTVTDASGYAKLAITRLAGAGSFADNAPMLVTLEQGATAGTTFTGGALSSALDEAKGADIASASTTNIAAATGNFVHITGTTTITAFGTAQAGARRVLTFDGALILTHHAPSLILPTGANITTAAGDTATMISEGSGNWRCTSYQRKDGTALTGAEGKHDIWIPAGAMSPSATGGCAALATIASAANQPDIQTLDFDATTAEYAQFSLRMPKSWNEGTVTFTPVWSHAATTTNFGVVWALQAVAVSDDDTIAVNYGTAQNVAGTGGTTNGVYIESESSAITIAGSPAARDMVFFRIARLPSDGSDTMAIDARLHGVTVHFTTDADTDA